MPPSPVLAAALALAAGACASTFEPTVPMRARSGDVELDLRALQVGGAPRFTYEARSTSRHTLGKIWLTTPDRAPCTGGAEGDQLVVDAEITDVLDPGSHWLEARFPGGAGGLKLDVVVDMEVAGGGCLRAPAFSQSLPVAAVRRRFVLVGGLVLDGTFLPDLRSVIGGGVGAGAWLGPVLLTAQVGVGVANCNAEVCGKDSGGALRTVLTVPVAAEARTPLGSLIRYRLGVVWLAGLRAWYSAATLPEAGGDRKVKVYALEAVLAAGAVDVVEGPFRRLERAPQYELSVPIGVVRDAGAGKTAFTIGLGLRWVTPL